MRKCPFCEKTRDEGAFIIETTKVRRCYDCRIAFIKTQSLKDVSLLNIDDFDEFYGDDDFNDNDDERIIFFSKIIL